MEQTQKEHLGIRCKGCKRLLGRSQLLKCTGCGRAYYCNKDCQKSDWKSHKNTCIQTEQVPTKIMKYMNKLLTNMAHPQNAMTRQLLMNAIKNNWLKLTWIGEVTRFDREDKQKLKACVIMAIQLLASDKIAEEVKNAQDKGTLIRLENSLELGYTSKKEMYPNGFTVTIDGVSRDIPETGVIILRVVQSDTEKGTLYNTFQLY